MKVFISYTRRDGIVNIDNLIKAYNHLSLKYDVFIHAIKSLENEINQSQVIDELMNSDVVILLYTDGCLISPWVNLEIELANIMEIPIISIDAKKYFLIK